MTHIPPRAVLWGPTCLLSSTSASDAGFFPDLLIPRSPKPASMSLSCQKGPVAVVMSLPTLQ